MFYSDPTLESLHPMALGQHERQPRLSYISGQKVSMVEVSMVEVRGVWAPCMLWLATDSAVGP